jgi:hypothetical protein
VIINSREEQVSEREREREMKREMNQVNIYLHAIDNIIIFHLTEIPHCIKDIFLDGSE